MKLPAGKEFDGPDTDFLLNCENGVLDLRTAGYDLASDTYTPPTLVSHEDSRERGDLITKLAYVNYDPMRLALNGNDSLSLPKLQQGMTGIT